MSDAVTLDAVVAWMADAADSDLSAVIETAQELQRERALAVGDVDAIIDEAFTRGFTTTGAVREPYFHSGLLVCPGYKFDKSKMNHDCSFVQISGSWVWESEEKVQDAKRSTLKGTRALLRTVTVIAPYDGMEVDQITSTTSNGVHERKSLRSWVVKRAGLELVAARDRSAKHTNM